MTESTEHGIGGGVQGDAVHDQTIGQETGHDIEEGLGMDAEKDAGSAAGSGDDGTGVGRKGAGKSGEKVADRGRAAAAAVGAGIAKLRSTVAQIVWIVCLVAALILAVGALLIAVKANPDNGLVKGVLNLADKADVGLFDLDNPIKKFTGSDVEIKTALLNYGLGALAWLIVGRVATFLIRPKA